MQIPIINPQAPRSLPPKAYPKALRHRLVSNRQDFSATRVTPETGRRPRESLLALLARSVPNNPPGVVELSTPPYSNTSNF